MKKSIIWAATVALAFPLPASASLVRKANLLTLHRNAGAILHGRCVKKTRFEEGRPVPYVEYTFEVIAAVKGCRDSTGAHRKTLTFRHVGGRAERRLADGTRVAPLRLGIPEYDVGREYVVFLTRESRLGYCAPVGLELGTFRVLRKDTSALVRNSSGNRGLFDGIAASAFADKTDLSELKKAKSTLPLKLFLDACRSVRK